MDNPFERYDLDPREGIVAITQRLKELAEDAKDDAERERIREAWEELTLHPARRLRAALFAHPETRGALGAPPSFPRRRAAGASPASSGSAPTADRRLGGDPHAPELGLRALGARPSVLVTGLAPGGARGGDAATGADEVPSLEDDPVLRGLP